MRTLIAPLSDEVGQQLAALDPWRRELARRYIRRLALEPYLGYPLTRGWLARERCRAVRFDRDSDPDDLFGSRPTARRRGNQDLSAGPRWRIVYWMRETTERAGPADRRFGGRDRTPQTRGPVGVQRRRRPPDSDTKGAAMGTLTLIRTRRYARLMSELPTPVRSMTLAEIQADHEQVYNLLEQGGVIRVYTEARTISSAC